MVKQLARYSSICPLKSALFLSSAYIVFCGIYIWVSGHLAASTANSVESLERIEWLKGTLFILATGLLFFIFSYLMLKRIARQSDELIEKKNALVLADRRAMAGAFALSIAHDMNNQIMVIRAGLEELDTTKNVEQENHILYIRRAVDDMARLSRQLLSMGRDSMTEDMQSCRLQDLFDGVADLASRHLRTRHCNIVPAITHGLTARLNPSIVSQMLFNLLINAADAMDGHGKIEVRITAAEQNLVIEVHDQGPGIPKEMRSEVMKPFFTTKKSGHGLGFMSVMASAEIHNGSMEILDSDLGGACIRITLAAT